MSFLTRFRPKGIDVVLYLGHYSIRQFFLICYILLEVELFVFYINVGLALVFLYINITSKGSHKNQFQLEDPKEETCNRVLVVQALNTEQVWRWANAVVIVLSRKVLRPFGRVIAFQTPLNLVLGGNSISLNDLDQENH